MNATDTTKTFSLRTILTVTTSRLLTVPKDGGNGIEDLYEILGHMTGDTPWTHTLGRFAEECKPWLYRWWPELGIAEASLAKLDEWISKDRTGTAQEGLTMWLTELKMLQPKLQDTYEVPRIPAGEHKTCDAIEELVERVGEQKIIRVSA